MIRWRGRSGGRARSSRPGTIRPDTPCRVEASSRASVLLLPVRRRQRRGSLRAEGGDTAVEEAPRALAGARLDVVLLRSHVAPRRLFVVVDLDRLLSPDLHQGKLCRPLPALVRRA